MSGPEPGAPWVFGEAPLPQTVRLAGLLRRVTAAAVSLEREEPAVERLIDELARAEAALAERIPPDPKPRVGADPPPDRRVYVDHGRWVGSHNPCFPEYSIEVTGDRAAGTVSFPLVYEGPPGLVHGGFLALFFDCVMQHHNCEMGVSGKTTTLNVTYRRPTPILVPLAFEVERRVVDRQIASDARLTRDGEVLCQATMGAVRGDRSRLPAVSPRRRS